MFSNPDVPVSDQLLRLKQVEILTGFSRSYLYGRIADKTFPAPIKIGKSSRWRRTQVLRWIAEKSASLPSQAGEEVKP